VGLIDPERPVALCNSTGVSLIAPELAAKRLELIYEVLPKATLIGELVDPANTYWQRVRPDYEQGFRALRMQPLFVEAHNPGEIEKAIARIVSRRADAFCSITRADWHRTPARSGRTCSTTSCPARRLSHTLGVCFLKTATTAQGRLLRGGRRPIGGTRPEAVVE
jgi:hypothetical protein